MTPDELVEKAERCLRLAQQNREAADELEALGNQLMAMAVKLETERERQNKNCR